MYGRVVAGMALAILLVPTAAQAAPYLQAGVDAARTGSTSDPGPDVLDVALRIDLPVYPGWHARAPVIIGDHAFFLRVAAPVTWDAYVRDQTLNGVYRIGLHDGTVERIVEIPGDFFTVTAFASDGDRLFVVLDDRVAAYTLDGDAAWSSSFVFPQLVPDDGDTTVTRCVEAAVRDGLLFLGCLQYHRLDEQAYSTLGGTPVVETFLLVLDAATGQEEWMWVWRGDTVPERPDVGPYEWKNPMLEGITMVAVEESHVVLVVGAEPRAEVSTRGPVSHYSIVALGRDSHEIEWIQGLGRSEALTWTPGPDCDINAATSDFCGYTTGSVPPIEFPQIAIRDDQVVVMWEKLFQFDIDSGRVVSVTDLRDDENRRLERPAVALAAGSVLASNHGTMFRVDPATRDIIWEMHLPNAGGWIGAGGMIVAGGRAYQSAAPGGLLAIVGLGSGELERLVDVRAGGSWRNLWPAVGEGVLVIGGDEIVVYGRTGASIDLRVEATNLVPAVDENVTLDLSMSVPGVQAPDLEFLVDWGDGTRTDWMHETQATHAFEIARLHTVTVHARNSAGQTSAQEIAVDVGGIAPASTTGSPVLDTTWMAGLAAVGFFVVAGVALAAARRRVEAKDATARAYRDMVVLEIEEGWSSAQLRQRLRPVRQRLGLSDRQHARVEADVRAGMGMAPASRDLVPGEVLLQRYAVHRRLGRGGGGTTYACNDTLVGRDVVLKVVDVPAGRDAAEAVVREARAVAAIDHPNVVTLYDVERVGTTVYLIMEYVRGRSLRSVLQRGALDRSAFEDLAEDLLDALDAVHRQGLVHRDVKPANVLLDPAGRARLIDFGVAVAIDPERTLAVGPSDSRAGTVGYMSPEQALGSAVGPPSDLFGAAATLYEALVGQPLFDPAGDASNAPFGHEATVARQDRLAGIPSPALRAWFGQALHEDPGHRFTDARDMRRVLRKALSTGRWPEAPARAGSSDA